MLYLTSDQHLGETRLDIMFRDFFESTEEHDNTIIENWNKTVSPSDTVVVLGDFAYDNEKLKLADKLNGKKHLILGNHDDLPVEEYEKYFITVEKESVFEKDGQKFYFNHYPSLGRNDMWNICGHIHGAWRFQKNTINVGVDCWGFTPVSFDQILMTMNAIEKYYDKDVWAYDLEANQGFDNRGLNTSYADKHN